MARRRFRLCSLAAMMAVATSVPLAFGQHGSMSMSFFSDETTFAPALSRADLDVFTRVLALKPAEQKAMEELHSAHGR